jgi:hypothetical protein
VFLVPWRREELTWPAVALGLQVWAFQSSLLALGVGGPAVEIAYVTLVGSIVACCGIVLRARWSALAAAASALALGSAFTILWSMPAGEPVRAIVLGTVGGGIAAAGVAAVIAWRTARSRLGQLDAVLT